ncbi:hypothetical protein NXX53_11665 [Bacteroides salyersiae]|nr:hypothetical protein [Bacteroides salyersiae]
MGYYKNRGDLRTETRRYNAARRRASKMGTLETVPGLSVWKPSPKSNATT